MARFASAFRRPHALIALSSSAPPPLPADNSCSCPRTFTQKTITFPYFIMPITAILRAPPPTLVHCSPRAHQMEVKFKAPKGGKSLLAKVAAKSSSASGRGRKVGVYALHGSGGGSDLGGGAAGVGGGGGGGREGGAVSRPRAVGKGRGVARLEGGEREGGYSIN